MQVQYVARDELGRIQEGVLHAADTGEASQHLRRDGLYPLSITETTTAHPDIPSTLIPHRVSRSEVIDLTNQLAILVETGVTLSTALAGIFEQTTNPTLKQVVLDLKTAVEGGEDFSTALAQHPKLFSKTFVHLVKASEAGGTMGSMLGRIGQHSRRELEARNKVRAAMAYPTIMLVMSVAVTLFLLAYVLPKFVPLFESRGVALPKPTVFMMAVSDLLVGYWRPLAGTAAGLAAGLLVFRTSRSGRLTFDWIRLHAPLLGPVFRKVAISQSIRTLATLINSRVPMLEAIRLSADVAGNIYYEDAWRAVAERVASGQQICDCLRGNPLFPPTLVQMIATGEETGKLGDVLARVSDHFDRDVETAVKAATSVLEPLMVAFMGVVVGSIALALLLPIFTLSRHVG